MPTRPLSEDLCKQAVNAVAATVALVSVSVWMARVVASIDCLVTVMVLPSTVDNTLRLVDAESIRFLPLNSAVATIDVICERSAVNSEFRAV